MLFNSQTILFAGAAAILSSTKVLVSAQAPPLYQAPYFSVSSLHLSPTTIPDIFSDFHFCPETRPESASIHLGHLQSCSCNSGLHAPHSIHSTTRLSPSRGSSKYSHSAVGFVGFSDRRLYAGYFGGDTF